MPIEPHWPQSPNPRDDFLHVLVLGPGYGESIILRIPPGVLVVVDCFRTDDRAPRQRNHVAEFLESRPEPVGAVLLTHPHDDHSPGLADLVNKHVGALVGCCEPLWVKPYAEVLREPDLSRRLSEGSTGQSLAAIRTAWESGPRRWHLVSGSVRGLGDAVVTVLYPTTEVLKRVETGRLRARPNRLSSPLLVEWRGLRLLLGADLEKPAWPRVFRVEELHSHHGFKVAHHASKNAFHPEVLRPSLGSPPWFTTPWRKAGGQLPNFRDGDGVARILDVVDDLLLSALPFRVQRREPNVWSRADLLRVSSGQDPDLPGASVAQEAEPEPEEGWIAFAFRASGECSITTMGARAARVVR